MATAAEGRNDPAPIIVKKVTVIEAGHHGGAWKVAYADFVTAMMAFFLLLWLLGATTEDQRKGLADYFTPTLVKTKEQSAGADGVLGGSSLVDVDNYPHAAGQTGTQTLTVPRDATGGPREGAASIKRIQERVAEAIAEKERLKRLMHQVRMIPTTTGIRIDLVDDADFSMFSLGTTVLTPDARDLLDLVAQAIVATELVANQHLAGRDEVQLDQVAGRGRIAVERGVAVDHVVRRVDSRLDRRGQQGRRKSGRQDRFQDRRFHDHNPE